MSAERRGVYQIVEEGEDAGRERWTLAIGPEAVSFRSEIERRLPEARAERLALDLGPDWAPRSLAVRVRSDAGERHYQGRRVGRSWISQVVREDGTLRTVTLPFDDGTHVDYFTPHTNSVTIHRLALRPGEGRDIDVVFIDPASLRPTLARQRYERLADDAGRPRYRYTNLGSGFQAIIWTDALGIVTRYEGLFALEEEPGGEG